MKTIHVRPSALEAGAKSLENITQDLYEQQRALGEIASEVEMVWQSRYTSEYTGKVQRVGTKVQNAADSISETAKSMYKTAEKIREVEKENAALFSGN